MINVIATVTTKPGQRAEVLRLFQSNVPHVLAEDGCIEYGAVIDVEDGPGFQAKIGTDTFFVIEKWRDLEALKAHAKAPHMASYGAAAKDFIAGRAIHVLQSA
jgi:quinol monooxygenase YgiN